MDEATGRRAMVPTGEEFTVECDLVLIAAGFTGCESYVAEAFGAELTPRGCVADTGYQTSVPGVFACGVCAAARAWSSGRCGKAVRPPLPWTSI